MVSNHQASLILKTSFQMSLKLIIGYNCKCNKDHYFLMNNGGESIDCAPCPTNFTQSFDGFDCVICDELCHKCSDSRGFLTEYNLNGKRLRDSENNLKRVCIECDSNDSSKIIC